MKRSEIFATIKDANKIADEMATLSIDSPEYAELNQTLGWTLDSIIACKYCSLNYSKRTGHYWVTF